jgi:DNA-directed RNA polymerase subunit RPC12/RpoP
MYKVFKRLYWAFFVFYPIAGIVVAIGSFKLWGTFVPAFIFAGMATLSFFYVSLRLMLWRCPHCGKSFRGEAFRIRFRSAYDACVHCGTKII